MARLRPLNVVLSLTDRFSNGLASAEGRIKRFGSKARSAGRGLTAGVTLPIVGAGAAATNFAVGFEDALAKTIALTDATREEVERMRRPLLDLATTTGLGPRKLAETFFFVRSSGLKGKDALEQVEAAAKASASGMGEAAIIANSSTSAVNQYGIENLSASRATDLLVEAVRKGKIEARTLGPVLGRVVGPAASLGVEFDDVAASLAALTRVSGNAELAGTGLRGILQGLLKPAEQSKQAMRAFGLSAEGLRRQLREEGLLSVLDTLRDTVGDNTAALGVIFPNMEGLVGLLSIMGQEAETVRSIFRGVAESVDSTNDAFEKSATSGRRLRTSYQSLVVASIKLGDALLPVVIPAIRKAASVVSFLGEKFAALSPKTQNIILAVAGFAAVLGPAILALGAIAAAVAAVGTTGLVIGGGIVAAGFIVAKVAKTVMDAWGPVRDFFRDLWEDVLGFFRSAMAGIRAILPDFVLNRLGFEGGAAPAPGVGGAAGAAAGAANSLAGGIGRALGEPRESRVGGRLDIRIDSETGEARVTRLESESRDFEIEVESGLALGTP